MDQRPAGWYNDDPSHPGEQSWWDGTSWAQSLDETVAQISISGKRSLANYDSERRGPSYVKRLVMLLLVIVVIGAGALALTHKPATKLSTTPTSLPTQLLNATTVVTPTVITNHSTCGTVNALDYLIVDLVSPVAGIPTTPTAQQTYYEDYEQANAINSDGAYVAALSLKVPSTADKALLTRVTSALVNLGTTEHAFGSSLSLIVHPTLSNLAPIVSAGEASVTAADITLSKAWDPLSSHFSSC
jgi:hypothetical protein